MCTTKAPPRKLSKPSTLIAQHNNKPPSSAIKTHTQQQDTPPSKCMNLENWETMPMEDLTEIIQARAAPLKIFFPPNNDLRPPSTLLHRSAVVLLGQQVCLGQMPFCIANSIAMRVDASHAKLGNGQRSDISQSKNLTPRPSIHILELPTCQPPHIGLWVCRKNDTCSDKWEF